MSPKLEAIAAYDAALKRPDKADWRAVAKLLRDVLPQPRVGKTMPRSDGHTEIADYVTKGKSNRRGPSMVVTFEDDTQVRMSFSSQEGKPINAGLGLRVVCSGYRTKRAFPISDLKAIAKLGVPSIRSAHAERDGDVVATFDPIECNGYTAPYRQGMPYEKWRSRRDRLHVAA
jgi:hypothetical protein